MRKALAILRCRFFFANLDKTVPTTSCLLSFCMCCRLYVADRYRTTTFLSVTLLAQTSKHLLTSK